MQGVVILGSTGSVGKKALEVIHWHKERYQLIALVANQNGDELFKQCQQYRPRYVVIGAQAVVPLKSCLKENGLGGIEVHSGLDVMQDLVSRPEVQIVVAGITGAAGLLPTLSAITAGKRVLLANKESLVMAGQLFRKALLETPQAELIPIDSEHNALFQCLHAYKVGSEAPAGVRRMILTASGGPFRTWPVAALKEATPEKACLHPIWSMGPKISVDSATLMNKGLEVIEAHWLFSMPPDKIEVLIHPQSIVHSLLEYEDGSTLAQLAQPDMAIPIAGALSWPDRLSIPSEPLNLARVAALSFEKVDNERFPCLNLAFAALRAGAGAPTVLNAANEVAVECFLRGAIGFMDIPGLVETVLQKVGAPVIDDLETVRYVDNLARQEAYWVLKQKFGYSA